MAMKKITVLLLILTFFWVACNNKNNVPDVSGIKVNLEVQRFEKDFFAIDTNNVSKGFAAASAEISFISCPYFLAACLGYRIARPF